MHTCMTNFLDYVGGGVRMDAWQKVEDRKVFDVFTPDEVVEIGG